MKIELKNFAEVELMKRLLYRRLDEITELEEHARSHGEVYTHPDRKQIVGLIQEVEASLEAAYTATKPA